MNKYIFKPYNPIFPTLFKKELNRLKKYLGNGFVIEHIGSTAIPDLGGKGIIDIYITASQEQREKLFEELKNAGYEYREKASTFRRSFFRADLPDPIEGKRRYHIHFGEPNSTDFQEAIAFRDYLRGHPNETKKYADVKKKAAQKANQDRTVYMQVKEPVIQEIFKKALGK